MKNKVIEISQGLVKKFIEDNRPKDPEIRKQIDLGYTYDGKAYELIEIRPVWNNPSEIGKYPFARIRYYKSRNEWNLYWLRASGKWELYDPFPSSKNLNEILDIINRDSYGCFFG